MSQALGSVVVVGLGPGADGLLTGDARDGTCCGD